MNFVTTMERAVPMHKYEVRLACLLLLGIGVCVGVQAGDEVRDRATLRGLKGVEVLIEDLPPQMVEDGLTAKQIQTDVELRLDREGALAFISAYQSGGPLAIVDCFGILSDDKIRCYFELGCEVKALGRGHIQRIKEQVRANVK